MTLPSDSEPLAADDGNLPRDPARENAAENFIVGVGASAGGLEAISELLKHFPKHAGIVVVVVQHLDPAHDSLLVELLGKVSGLPVEWAADGKTFEPGHIYVAPRNVVISVRNGIGLLQPATRGEGAIDYLFRSLAEELRDRAIGVVLSGMGADGMLGLKAIKAAGGIGFAQDPDTAAFPTMPRASIDAGCVDRVLAPAAIAEDLMRLTHTSRTLGERMGVSGQEPVSEREADQLAQIFRILAVRTGVEFSDYKQTTVKRRLVRRMVLTKTPDLSDYLKLLQKSREEVDALYESLLINVTEFFRDFDHFDFLGEQVIPAIVERHRDNTPIRIWVPGCSTGEEAYSLGILVREQMEAKGQIGPVQIFGTDVSERSIAYARAGVYSQADVANVAPERLRRFFFKTERGYVVQKPIRDVCVFARQNVVKDSPFSRLDLISCRNLMIYLSPKLQRKLMPVFHYALNPGGYLVLGTSESVGGHAELYRLVDRRFRIYLSKSTSRRAQLDFSLHHLPPEFTIPPKPAPAMADESKEPFDIIREADRVVLSRLGTTGVLINEDLEILQFRGDVSPYLAPVEGRASLNMIKMAREGLAAELQAVVQQAKEKHMRVQKRGVSLMQGSVARLIDLDVTPIDTAQTKERFYLVLFSPSSHDTPLDSEPKAKAKKSVYLAQIEQLRQDLQATRNYLQASIEKHETTNQELRAANEEIQSSNEELQSTNEELETAKEELQSTNEELTTVNEELHSRQLELIQVNNDLNNLINSVHLPIIILGQDMRIRRFTPMAEKVLNVIPTDIGRPLSDININLNVRDLPQLMAEVVDSLTIKELEVQDNRGRWYSMRLRPYKTAEHKIEGVVITLIDIDQMKRTISELEETRVFGEAVIESMPEPLVVLTAQLRIKVANDAFLRLFRLSRERALNQNFFEGIMDNRAGEFRSALEGILRKGSSLTEYEVYIDLPGAGSTRLLINARQIANGSRSYPLILLSLQPPG